MFFKNKAPNSSASFLNFPCDTKLVLKLKLRETLNLCGFRAISEEEIEENRRVDPSDEELFEPILNKA